MSTRIVRTQVLSATNPSPIATAIGNRSALVVLSPTVYSHYGSKVKAAIEGLPAGQRSTCVLETGETRKTLKSVEELIANAHACGLPRDGVIVGIGGGVLLDLVGLAASLFRRGIPHLKIGTTLVAQTDAAVGLKCGANSSGAKNIVGAFYPPELVLTDGTFLTTLNKRDIRCGLSEMVKLAISTDAGLFHMIAAEGALLLDPANRDSVAARRLIDRSIIGMTNELNANPFESDLRRRVDFGHTISGAFEVASGHSILHGEAVALDVALFSALSMLLGHLTQDELDGILQLHLSLGIKIWNPIMEDSDLIERGLAASASHRGRRLNLPLPDGIGQTFFVTERSDLPDGLIDAAIAIVRQAAAKPCLIRH
jgi:3-dehydroquinate synthase